MITFADSSPYSRRSFLQVGGLGLGGLSLSQLIGWRASAAKAGIPLKNKSVVFLFMHGGPPQQETFDPKMDAPAEIRSSTGEVKTSIPGVTFGSTFEKLAERANRLAIVRSYTTGNGNHDIKPIVGKDSLGANIGSLFSRIAGANVPATGMPRNVALFPRAVDADSQERVKQFGNLLAHGTVGASCAPFAPGSAKNGLQGDMTMWMSRQRLEDRMYLLNKIDNLKRAIDNGAADGLGELQEQAVNMITGGISEAFDLSGEDPRTIASYDTAPLINPNSISKSWNNHRNYRDHGQTLGKLMLLARRLCERGAGFVTVTTNFVWDFHSDKNNAGAAEGMDYCGVPFDHAVSAFLDDLHERGLSDQILLVCCGEMGRTPKLQNNGGRNHWGRLAPLMLAGGGLRMGQVIGESSPDAGEPASNPVTTENLIGTIMHTLLDVGQVRLMENLPRDVHQLVTSALPIKGLS
ncbi:MAG TPA: DUF1501 domain-containing protein [Verrucomicrobiales bacterium]|nr:DUF1501 domain-containing protein [Verrucomicrobiales bacterium]